ncbi:MAG: hypothetical protein G8237_00115 [Magnetococcales bacterium]|nr:hypothetical protein [Magnetococcales bacterium]
MPRPTKAAQPGAMAVVAPPSLPASGQEKTAPKVQSMAEKSTPAPLPSPPAPLEAVAPVEEPSGPAVAVIANDPPLVTASPPAPVVAATPPPPVVQKMVSVPTPAPVTPPAPPAAASGSAPAPPAAMPRDSSPVAQWQRACQERLAWGKRMVEDGLGQCPKAGYMRQNCLDYYRGLERRFQGVTCDPKGGGMPMPGW